MGDAAGVGPELVLRAHEQAVFDNETVVVGDYSVLERCRQALDLSVQLQRITRSEIERLGEHAFSAVQSRARERAAENTLLVCDLALLNGTDVSVGEVSALSGEAAARYVELATRLALGGLVGGVVTCPINKEATRLALPGFTGHTELIADLCGSANVCMLLWSSKLAVSHVSTHVSLAEAIQRVTPERVLAVIRLTHSALARLVSNPRLAVCGLNPHAGEGGAFGNEDIERIAPAIKAAKDEGMSARGPIPADTVFHRAVSGEFDAVVCMYHDQGHIPMKTLDFHGGVNVTLGLPIIRTSVDHGTAFDIAWKGIASTVSLSEAYKLASRLTGS